MRSLLVLAITISLSLAITFPEFYHSTSEIKLELEQLEQSCPKMKIQKNVENPDMNVISFNEGSDATHKAFLLFGEHAREFISPETGLHFMKKLCSNEISVKNVASSFQLKMVLNANPYSRMKAEQGDFCLRENENGVDINRNYESHWNPDHDPDRRTNPGPFAFSEVETKVIKDLLAVQSPTVFISVHSGTLGLFAPYAYTEDLGKVYSNNYSNKATENEQNYMDVLNEVYSKHCDQCKVGACGKQVGYLSPGTSMDFAYDDMNIKYSYTYEIFHQKIDLRKTQLEASFLQEQDTSKQNQGFLQAEKDKKDELLRTHSCFAGVHAIDLDNDGCFKYFNPVDQDQYNYYIENWANALFLTLDRVYDKENSQIIEAAKKISKEVQAQVDNK